MKLSFSTLGCPGWDLAKVLDYAVKYGYDAVDIRGLSGVMKTEDIPGFQPERIEATKAAFAESGVKLLCIGTSCSFHAPDKFSLAIDEGKRTLDLCATLGVPYIRVFGNSILSEDGAEETKGNKLVKETHALLKQEKGLNFVGNIEGNNALSGDCDVLVADGFAGNQVFKSAEGIARRLITDIVKYAKTTGSKEIMGLVGHLMGIYDFSALGGGIVLGAGKPIIKARGSAKPEAVVNTAAMLLNMAKNRDVFYGKDER